MTIALGILCRDGIVLGTDEQYTTGVIKTPGQKLFTLQPTRDVSVCIAGAGSVGFMKMTVEMVDAELRSALASEPPTINLVQQTLKTVLHEVFTEHIYPIPGLQPTEYAAYIQLLVGVWVRGEELALWSHDQTAVHSIADHTCIGSGAYLAQYLMDQSASESMSSAHARLVAIHTVHTTKEYVEFCGKGTAVQILHTDGSVEKVDEAEIKGTEVYFSHIPIITGYLLGSPAAHDDEMLDTIVGIMKQELALLQAGQRERQERQKRIQKMIESRRPKRRPADLT